MFPFSGPPLTVVDTPGFGDDLEQEERTIDELVEVLKDRVKFVHAFLIVFNGESPRMTLRWGSESYKHNYNVVRPIFLWSFTYCQR